MHWLQELRAVNNILTSIGRNYFTIIKVKANLCRLILMYINVLTDLKTVKTFQSSSNIYMYYNVNTHHTYN